MERNFIELDALNLRDHGDAREKELWPKVSNTLSHYESFWRTLVVLLTNRVTDSSSEEWIHLRSTVPCAYERLAMHSYSLFYFAATAWEAIDDNRERLASNKYQHPERTFFALHAATDHATKLRSCARKILSGLDIQWKFPKHKRQHPDALYYTIKLYRNAFTHDPVLGRGLRNGQEFLPPAVRLPQSEKEPCLSWRQIASIPLSDMVNGLELQEKLWHKLAIFLQNQWGCLTQAFVEARKSAKFLEDVGLNNDLLPIKVTLQTSVSYTVGPSGTTSLGSGAIVDADMRIVTSPPRNGSA
jgi:hypothetical protein